MLWEALCQAALLTNSSGPAAGNIIQEHSFKPMQNCLAALLAANPGLSMQHKCLPDPSEANIPSWQDGTSQPVCSQELQVVELNFFLNCLDKVDEYF